MWHQDELNSIRRQLDLITNRVGEEINLTQYELSAEFPEILKSNLQERNRAEKNFIKKLMMEVERIKTLRIGRMQVERDTKEGFVNLAP